MKQFQSFLAPLIEAIFLILPCGFYLLRQIGRKCCVHNVTSFKLNSKEIIHYEKLFACF
ncbi:hypothetical protein P378_16530 [Desulforamulus profundi]|uniref:Uncharacterized protein n=1 Tax=Desulforamulus profundi TaxID=1383067 RepID=A0A2C6MBU3_9FIRM|nr:hypothetical protein P378_16530 [Desulforamulus profundi]